ncbi:hypothetical protein FQA39_LY17394 [Lamprigera yunnana]|nr:hypothetical protein FQA39_LY17394 [Lamprigera yunnana]
MVSKDEELDSGDQNLQKPVPIKKPPIVPETDDESSEEDNVPLDGLVKSKKQPPVVVAILILTMINKCYPEFKANFTARSRNQSGTVISTAGSVNNQYNGKDFEAQQRLIVKSSRINGAFAYKGMGQVGMLISVQVDKDFIARQILKCNFALILSSMGRDFN